jgi:hypothetical protein
VSVPVTVKSVGAAPTAVVIAATTWADFATAGAPMLDRVWGLLRSDAPAGLYTHSHNVTPYKDDIPNVEVGVLVHCPFDPIDPVVPSAPAGDFCAVHAPRRIDARRAVP